MPRNKTLATLPALTYAEQLAAIFRFPGLKDLQDVLPAEVPPGERLQYPRLLSYGVAVAARIYGSQEKALTELSNPEVWKSVTREYCALIGIPNTLPPRPPSASQQDKFLDWLVEEPSRLAQLSADFTASAIGQARHQGNFPDDSAVPDWTKPDPRHLVFGDGTIYKRYSRVVEVLDKATGELTYPKSRARTGRPRVQQRLSNTSKDGKGTKGINHVTTMTWTRSGWVVLTNDQAFDAEVKMARRQVERLHTVLGNRLHTVLWDRAVSGFDVEHFFATRRVLVINKPVARGHASCAGYTPPRLEADEVERLYRSGEPIPVGYAVYDKGNSLEVVRTKYRPYRTWTGDGCRHDLWVDDGALVTVTQDPHTHRLHKTATATAVEALPLPSEDGYRLPVVWTLRCENGKEHRLTTSWQPRQTKEQKRPDHKKALRELRPLPRADHRFREVYGLRNNTESYHAWLKARLGTGTSDRATRLSAEKQFVDHLCVGSLANALSYYRDDLLHR